MSKKQKAQVELLNLFFLTASTLLALGIIGLLLMTVSDLPRFGSADNPAANEVYTRYVEKGMEETGAKNIVAAMILDYRAFDTLGEAIVLFTAIMGVVMLIRTPDGTSVNARGRKEREDNA
jgi:multicomponent Na+:H+ antiporter subunit B